MTRSGLLLLHTFTQTTPQAHGIGRAAGGQHRVAEAFNAPLHPVGVEFDGQAATNGIGKH